MTFSQPLSNANFSSYDRTRCSNVICHIGIGQFHRSHQALYLHKLKSRENCDWQITGLGLLPNDAIMQSKLASQDLLYSVLSLGKQQDVTVVGSMLDYLATSTDGYAAVINAVVDSRCKIVTLTITEHGYLQDHNGDLNLLNPAVINDLACPEQPKSVYGLLYSALKARHDNGLESFTIMSCDNLPCNGNLVKKLLLQFISRLDADLANWVEASTSFPNTMVDRITPKTTDVHLELLRDMGIEDQWPVVAEDYSSWIVEDNFTTCPPLEEVGVVFTKDVKDYEEIKLFLLNAGHSAIAYLALIAGIEHVDEAMANDRIAAYAKNYMKLIIPVLPQIPDMDINNYINTLLSRFSNPHIKDQIARLASHGHAKITNFVLPPLKRLLSSGGDTSAISILFASWIVFLAKWDVNEIEDVMKNALCPAATVLYKTRQDADLKNFMKLAFPQLVGYDTFLLNVLKDMSKIEEGNYLC